jgi:Predicted membrane protein (DUF2232)
MIVVILIALAAGCASATMFASIISGALVSLLLLSLAPLPLMAAALGWGSLCAAIGGLAAAIGLGVLFGLPCCIVFVIGVALPAWWLGHLALLGRSGANSASPGNDAAPVAPDLEWYPVGRILLWIAGFATLATMAALLSLGTDGSAIASTLRQGLLRMFSAQGAGSSGEIEQFIDAMVAIAPAATVMVAMMTLTLNLWLAARITATSGRLHRPWPDLKLAALPPMTLAALCVAVALCFTGGLLAILAQIVTTALMMAYALAGFAVLHLLTLPFKSRALWLSCTYVLVMMFVWPLLAMVVLGLADAIFGLRQRYLQGRPPPLPAS